MPKVNHKPSTKSKPAVKKSVGRPTSYRQEYAEQARKLCFFGATDKEIAAFFEIAESRLYLWRIKVREFSEALCSAQEI